MACRRQSGLDGLTADAAGFTDFAVELGPFGGADEGGPLLWVWVIVYLGLISLAARAGFMRRDL